MQTVAAMYPSQYRKYLKMWKKYNVAAIHESGFQWLVKHAKRVGGSYKESNGIIYRVFFPVYVEAEIPNSIQFALSKAGYRIDADNPEYCIDKYGRQVSVNKAYQLIAKKQRIAADVINDNMREYAENLGSAGVMLLCVSRHPYDIAGMSTGRAAWNSCHTLGGDVPKEKARKRAKYAKEMEAYKKEIAELGLDEQGVSDLREKYFRELEEFRQKQDPLVAAVDEAQEYYDQAHADADKLSYSLERLVGKVVDRINAGQRKIIAAAVSKNTGIPETFTEVAVFAAMRDEYAIDDLIRRKLVVKSLPNITQEQREFFDFEERKVTKLTDRIFRFIKSVISVDGKVYVDAEGNRIWLIDGKPEITPAAEYEVDRDRLAANMSSVEELYYGCVDDYIDEQQYNEADAIIQECIVAIEGESLAQRHLVEAQSVLYALDSEYPVEPNLPEPPVHPDELPVTTRGSYSHLVAEDVITGSVIVYAIKPKLSLLTSIEKVKRVDARIASTLNARLDKSNKDPLFEPLGRIILRTANGKYLRPGALYGFSYSETIRTQFKKMAKLLSVALNKAIRRDSGGTEPLYHEYDPEVDRTYLEGRTDERFGFATTRDVKTTPRNRDSNPHVVLEDEPIVDEHIAGEPFDFDRDVVEEMFPGFYA